MLNVIKKKINYLKSNLLLKLFKIHKNNFCLICHSNFIDSLDYKLINDYCLKYNIDYKNVSNYLFQRISKSFYIYQLFSGPTVIIFFTDVDKYINFFSEEVVKNKFLPFYLLHKESLYNYKNFENFIKKNYLDKKTKLNLQKNIIELLNNNNIKLIKNLNLYKLI